MKIKLIILASLFLISCATKNTASFDTMKVSLTLEKNNKEIKPIVGEVNKVAEKPVSNKTQETDNTDSTDKVEKTDNTDKVEETDNTETDNTDKVEETDNTDSTDKAQETDSVQTINKKLPSGVDKEIAPGDEIPETISQIVRVKTGDYKITSSIKIEKNGALIIAPGTNLELEETEIFCNGKFYALGTSESPISFFGEWDNITISGAGAAGFFAHCKFTGGLGKDVSIDSNNNYKFAEPGRGDLTIGGAILFFNKAQGSVENCEVFRSSGKGALAILESKVKLINNHIHDNYDIGLFIYNSSAVVKENKILANSKPGVLCESNVKSQIIKNTISDNKESGLTLRGAVENIVRGNTFANNAIGVTCTHGNKSKIEKNNFNNNKQTALVCEASSPNIEGNIFLRNGNIAILFSNGSKGSVINNKISQHRRIAIGISTGSAPKIDNNTIESSVYGIGVEAGVKPDIGKNNKFINCQAKVVQSRPNRPNRPGGPRRRGK